MKEENDFLNYVSGFFFGYFLLQEKFQPSKFDVESDVRKPQRQEVMDPSLLDDIIIRLMSKPFGRTVPFTEFEISQLCDFSRKIFLEQPNLLELEAPVKICGKLTTK